MRPPFLGPRDTWYILRKNEVTFPLQYRLILLLSLFVNNIVWIVFLSPVYFVISSLTTHHWLALVVSLSTVSENRLVVRKRQYVHRTSIPIHCFSLRVPTPSDRTIRLTRPRRRRNFETQPFAALGGYHRMFSLSVYTHFSEIPKPFLGILQLFSNNTVVFARLEFTIPIMNSFVKFIMVFL